MKLSEAIRLGGMLKPQARRRLVDFETGGVCAMGAALSAISALPAEPENMDKFYRRIEREWPILLQPVTSARTLKVHIMRLNDCFGWTREQIADYVETIERAQEEATGVSVEREVEPAVATVGAKRPTESLQS